MLTKEQLASAKAEAISAILPLLSSEDTYVDLHVRYCVGIKHLNHNGGIGLYSTCCDLLQPMSLWDMPLESLLEVLEQLKVKRGH